VTITVASGVTTFVERVFGTVALASGGAVRVRMFNEGVIRPDGTFVHSRTTLDITPLTTP
jgi:hypothetical protein